MLDRRTAMTVPENAPGRGMTTDRHHFMVALPRADGRSTVSDVADGTTHLIGEISRNWRSAGAPPVRLLPQVLPYQQLPIHETTRTGIPIGISELDLSPVFLDLDADPHFLVYGTSESGKTAFLRAFAKAIVDRNSPDDARIVVIDYRRGLLDAIKPPHLIAFGATASRAQEILAEIAQVMRSRMPGPDLTSEELRNRSWWRGPQLYVLVDDYDLVAGPSGNPLAVLQEYLGHGRDIGLHVIIARRTGGAARALYEAVTMSIRELGSSGLLLSGEREEGALLGNMRASQQPPGRGWLVTRRSGAALVQLAWTDPPQ
jgi:S-DNA-T family DNA segregation ATPase FtsK/SpoIIIE